MERKYKVEICANSVLSCIEAEKGGANRVELCSAIPEGGLTPSYGDISLAKELLKIDLNVIIRSRSGDFCYTPQEIESMRRDVEMCSKLEVSGVVFGVLTPDGDVDVASCNELLAKAKNVTKTFHRAFDVCRDPFEALETIIKLGFDRILTSGQAESAYLGRELIAKLVERAAGRIIIMAGCGVNEDNISEISAITNADEYHFSARKKVESKMKFRKEGVPMGAVVKIDEFSNEVTSAERVRATISNLNK
ncbi:MAG: copper homeostasis protein CutC [Rikenellaceae bacterium]